MSKVKNEKSETKKQGGDNGHSFQKNTGDFHEAKEKLTQPATKPVIGAHGQEPAMKPQTRPDGASSKAADTADEKSNGTAKQAKGSEATQNKR